MWPTPCSTLRSLERRTWPCSAYRELRPGTRNGDEQERRPKLLGYVDPPPS
jgi:hypothetical protein